MSELDPGLYTVAWIAPLEIEAQAALHMLDHRHRGRFPMSRGDDYVFQAGDMCGHNVIIATLPAGQEYGNGSAAALASQVKGVLSLTYGLDCWLVLLRAFLTCRKALRSIFVLAMFSWVLAKVRALDS